MHIAGPSFSTVEFDNERILFTMQALILLHGTLDLLRLLEMHQNHVRGKIIIGRVTHCSCKSGYWSTCWKKEELTVRCWCARCAPRKGWTWFWMSIYNHRSLQNTVSWRYHGKKYWHTSSTKVISMFTSCAVGFVIEGLGCLGMWYFVSFRCTLFFTLARAAGSCITWVDGLVLLQVSWLFPGDH